MKIIKADEPLLVTSIKMLIYGEPSAGKTSLAFSAEKPLCLDFDRGAYRSAFRKDSVKIESWEEVSNIRPAEVSGYKTLIVDTVGRQLDMIATHVIRNNRKLSTKTGNLTRQGYGELKAVFAQWVKMIEQLGLDIIFVAHNKEEKDGDTILMRPDIQGSSYHEVFKVADAIGYMRILNRRRTIDFEPTEQHVGKDTARIGLVEIDDLHDSPSFGADLIFRVKDSINNASEAGKIATDLIESFRIKLDECADLDCLNDIRVSISEIKNQFAKDKSKQLLIQRMHAMNAVWSKEKEQFVTVSEEQGPSSAVKDLDWWEKKTDSIKENLQAWWETEKDEAAKDLGKEDLEKLSRYVNQLIDAMLISPQGNEKITGQWSAGAQKIIDAADKIATAKELDKFRAGKRLEIDKLGDEAGRVFEYLENAYNALSKGV